MSNNPEIQTRANHMRFHPPFHFVTIPLVLMFLVLSFIQLFRSFTLLTVSLTILSVALLVMAFLTRIGPLKVQDRLIRLEEQLRMMVLLPEDLRPRLQQLKVGQYVALRFAGDAELPSLVRMALDENLTGRQIKERIQQWRGDYFRV